MRKITWSSLFLLGLVGCISSAFGQEAGIAINPTTGTVGTSGGATTPGSFTVVFTNTSPTATISALQTEIVFDNTQLTITPTSAGGNTGCQINSGTPNTVTITSFVLSGTMANGTLCTLAVTAANPQTAGATYSLNVTNTSCSDAMSDPVSCAETDATITVTGAPANTAPTVALGPSGGLTLTGGTGNVTGTVTDGTGTGSLDLSCTTSSGFTISPSPAVQTIPATGGSFTSIGVTCTPAAMPQSGTITCVQTPTPSETPARGDLTLALTCPVVVTGAVSPTINNITGTTLSTVSGSNRTGTVTIDVATAGSATADLAVNCSIPAGSAGFAVTAGATRTIIAPAALGANAPAVGLQCTPQSTLQTATLTCTRTASDGTTPGDTTATITCPAATAGTATPTITSSLSLTGPSGTPTSGTVNIGNSGTAAYDIVAPGCTITSGSGYTVSTISTPFNVPPGSVNAITVGCTPGTSTPTGTLTCNHNASLVSGGVVTSNLTCSVAAPGPAPAVAVPTMGTAAKVLMALLMLGFGLVGFQLYRRSA